MDETRTAELQAEAGTSLARGSHALSGLGSAVCSNPRSSPTPRRVRGLAVSLGALYPTGQLCSLNIVL